jgi:SAM-dependent methyltransferase
VRVADVERDPLPEGPFDAIVLSEVVGLLDDVQRALERLHTVLAPGGRLVVTYYNFVWEPVLKLADKLGVRTPWPEQNWLSMGDLVNLLELADFEVVRRGTDVLLPAYVPGVSELANRVAAKLPGVQERALISYFVARAMPAVLPAELPGVTVVCPTRNEKGNIREAVARTPLMGPRTELLFVDGHSTDGTVEEIEAVRREYEGPLDIGLLHQDGKGKGDAVFKGFDHAKNEVLMILDSDLTAPPEDLPKFYRALVAGKGELINGVRLVYPMEGEAMRFLNLVGNKFFSLALSWLLEQPIKDSLCGTKVLTRESWRKISAQRSFFGDFDAFGDFDLLFGAARLNLKITDLPVRYRARTFGETKMDRFTHGWHLLRMTAFGFKKLRMGL